MLRELAHGEGRQSAYPSLFSGLYDAFSRLCWRGPRAARGSPGVRLEARLRPVCGPDCEVRLPDRNNSSTRLAAALPARNNSWRPAEVVRSVHFATANYRIARTRATALPEGSDFRALQAISNEKPTVVQAFEESFAQFRQEILARGDVNSGQPQSR